MLLANAAFLNTSCVGQFQRGEGSLRGKKICLLDIVNVRVVAHCSALVGVEADILGYGL